MSTPVETYRGVEINKTVEIVGFHVPADYQFCMSLQERAEDSAPILEMYETVEAAREDIDAFLDASP